MRKLHDLPAVDESFVHGIIGPVGLFGRNLHAKTWDRFDLGQGKHFGKDGGRARVQVEQALAGLRYGHKGHLSLLVVGESALI